MDLKVKVEMLAYGSPNEVREVVIKNLTNDADLPIVLEETYYWGQNDFQPQQNHPSVSSGDVIEYCLKHYLVCFLGFRLLSDKEYNEYKAMSKDQRMIWAMTRKSSIY